MDDMTQEELMAWKRDVDETLAVLLSGLGALQNIAYAPKTEPEPTPSTKPASIAKLLRQQAGILAETIEPIRGAVSGDDVRAHIDYYYAHGMVPTVTIHSVAITLRALADRLEEV